jgi:polyisoprenoid-binding protein YceI
MFKAITVIAVAALLSFSTPPANSWKADGIHSRFGFSVTHLGINTLNGQFKDYTITINNTAADFSDAVIELSADVNSLSTDNEMRDGHLKGPDFFEVAKYAKLTFKSTSFKKVKGKNFKLTGDLTLHGVTKKVELDAVYNGSTTNPQSKKELAGFRVTGTIKRSDFGIGNGFPAPMLSDEVALAADLEFIKD